MCFSTTASIGAGVALGLIGVASLKKAEDKFQYPLAAIPLLFSFQQFTEGVVWLSLTSSGWENYQSAATIGFLIIAQALWPLCLPFAILQYEQDPGRKRILKLILGTGAVIAAYFLYCMFTYNVNATIYHDHIFYKLDYPVRLVPIAAGIYLISTVGPPLVSANRKIQLMGILILVSYIITRLFFQPALVSVWCFFGTAIGILVYAVVSEKQTTKRNFAVAMTEDSGKLERK
jgi:hypothetical protein